MVVAALVLLAPSGAFAQQSAAIQTWQQNLSNAPPTQPGCYEADYPGTWRQVVCVKNQSSQPNVPMSLPPPTSNGNVPAGIIGDGTDYAAKVPATNPIASVVGSFVDVTGVNSVASYYICRIPDDYIDPKRYPLLMARAALRELIESLQSPLGVLP